MDLYTLCFCVELELIMLQGFTNGYVRAPSRSCLKVKIRC
jgi:hypothetical protein